jgi:alpha-galactosidase
MYRTVRCALLVVLGAVSLLAGATAADARVAPAPAEKPPLAPTPPMGWNSWNKFGCDIDEQLIRETADAMVSSGMAAAGYRYVDIDDCWMAPSRDAQGRLRADPQRFPGGIEAVADYVHGKGLKLGIYSSAGTATCQGLPASLDHETTDAASFAEWGVDLLKYDNCNNQGRPAPDRYTAMANALQASGRDIVFSVCEWGSNQPWQWAAQVGGHYWRTTGDISDDWDSMVSIVDKQVGLEAYSGPNAWNDPDMLEVGNGGMTTEEYRAHISMWSLLNAPLIAGNDLRSMDATTLSLLTDPDVLAVNQDWAGTQGHKIADAGERETWTKPTSDGGAAVVLLNRATTDTEMTTTAADLGLPAASEYSMRDLWSDETTVTSGEVRASVPGHGVRMFVVHPNAS